ncbi:MAG: 4-(cytidine 5'-diphospho)-2-C-methyl-D-erythritol kinase, partial [Betaproteobacteria bacterium]
PIAPAEWRPGSGHNDLEPVACARFPAIAEHLHWLRRHAPQALMTGSGACVFAAFPHRASAEAVFRRMPHGMRGWLAGGLDAHPLADL